MPFSVPVSRLMIHHNKWPQLRAETDIRDVIRSLRIGSEEKKISQGHSTPLILDDSYTLLGLVRLTDLLAKVRHLCDDEEAACALDLEVGPVEDLVQEFPDSVEPEDSILKALDIMIAHNVSLIPVMKDGQLTGLIQLSDVFNEVASLFMDADDPETRDRALRRLRARV